MKLQALRSLLEQSLTYPTDAETVRERIGDVPLDAPDEADTRTVGNVLTDLDAEEYDSAGALFESIYANLPDSYIGRKYYSDRGGHTEATVEGWADGPNRSF